MCWWKVLTRMTFMGGSPEQFTQPWRRGPARQLMPRDLRRGYQPSAKSFSIPSSPV